MAEKERPRRTMSVKEAAAHLGVGLSTTYEMFKRGELEGYRVRRRVVIYKSSVEAVERMGRNAGRLATPARVQPFADFPPPPGLFRGR